VLCITGIAWRQVLQEDGIRAAQMIRTLKRLKHEEAQREVANAPPGIPVEIANANLANAALYDDTEEEEQEEQEKNEPSTSHPKK
jgi:ribosomal protein L12E/L44/L45/RPP1/RPP2